MRRGERVWWARRGSARFARRMRTVLAAVVVSALGVLGCHGSSEPRVASVLTGLPEYTPEEATAFDDVISANVFGFRPDVDPAKDPNMAPRVSHADWVAR